MDVEWLRQEATHLFQHNRLGRPQRSGPAVYHAPSLGGELRFPRRLPPWLRWSWHSLWLARLPWLVNYPHQWSLDSCCHAIALSHLDVPLAQAELESLLSAQQPDGFIPHMVWNRRHMHWVDRVVMRPIYGSPVGSRYLAPPLLAESVEAVYGRSQDMDFLRRVLPGVKKLYSYIEANRVAEDGLAEIIISYEAKDRSPEYDLVYGEPNTRALWRGPMFRLMLRHRLLGWDTRRILASQRFRVKDLMFNVIYANNLSALGRLCQAAGEAEAAARYRSQAERVEAAILAKTYDRDTGLFFSLDSRRGRDHHLRMSTISSLLPLALATIDLPRLDKLINEHLCNPEAFWAPYPVPVQPLAVAPDDAASYPIWRGPQTWMITNWYLARGLRLQTQRFPERRQKFSDIADEMTLKSYEMVRRWGFREFYDARTGRGHRAAGLGWSALVLDMAVNNAVRPVPKNSD